LPNHSVLINTPLQTQGTLLESMDALFIGWKKSAGRSVRNPLFGTVLFDDDTEVEEFVQQHPLQPVEQIGCVETCFLQQNYLRH